MIMTLLYNKLDAAQKSRIDKALLDPCFKAFVEGHIFAFQQQLLNLDPAKMDEDKFRLQYSIIRGRMVDWQDFGHTINLIEAKEKLPNPNGNEE